MSRNLFQLVSSFYQIPETFQILLFDKLLFNSRGLYFPRLASETIVLSTLSSIGEIFKLSGDEKNYGRSLRLQLKLATQFDCNDSR